MAVYTPGVVENVCRSYLSIRNLLAGGPPQGGADNPYAETPRDHARRERPFGQTAGDPRPWPFMEPLHATPPRDGKAKAKARQELHAMVIDLEQATHARTARGDPLVSDDDLELVLKYYILESHTLDELVREKGLSSRGSMSARLKRALARFAYAMENHARANL